MSTVIEPAYQKYPKPRFRKMPDWLLQQVAGTVKALLHAGWDAMRNRGVDTRNERLGHTEPYYCEAFGLMRAMHVMGYGYFGPSNFSGTEERGAGIQPEQNLSWWFDQLVDEVREEEGFNEGSYRCDYCLERYSKDTRSMIDNRDRTFFRWRFEDESYITYVWYDGPVLVHYIDGAGSRMIGTALPDERYMYIEVTAQEIVDFEAREITLLQLIQSKESVYIDDLEDVSLHLVADLDARDLPGEDSYLPGNS